MVLSTDSLHHSSSSASNPSSGEVAAAAAAGSDVEEHGQDGSIRYHKYGKFTLFDTSTTDDVFPYMWDPLHHGVVTLADTLCSDTWQNPDVDGELSDDEVWSRLKERFVLLCGGIKEQMHVTGNYEDRMFDLIGVEPCHPQIPPFLLVRIQMEPGDDARQVMMKFQHEFVDLLHTNKNATGSSSYKSQWPPVSPA